MKILHTSDWHLGRTLYGQKRYKEFSAFLDWLVQTIEKEEINALLVAGDIFDTSTPSNRAQELYYRFLAQVSTSCCRHIVIIGGNHDSPSFLNAPKALLHALNVHIVGSKTENPAQEVILLRKNQQTAQADTENIEAIVCAVPYLRDKDVRTQEAGETIDDKNRKLIEGIREHYAKVVQIAEEKREKARRKENSFIPVIAMGHLFMAGGKTIDGDGVRELYVGSLAHIGEDSFPSSIDYFALGHLHVAQKVNGKAHIRYSGSPIPMGYGEAEQEKKIVIVEFDNKAQSIKELTVPCFQPLLRITGSHDNILARLEELKEQQSSAWLEIEYTGKDIISNLREILDKSVNNTALEILRIKNRQVMDSVIRTKQDNETLDDLDANDVFNRCLDTHKIPEKDREVLINTYNEIVKILQEEDRNAE